MGTYLTGTYSVIHTIGDADFNNFVYSSIYFNVAGAFIINGIVVIGVADNVVDIIVNENTTTLSTDFLLLGNPIAPQTKVKTGLISGDSHNEVWEFVNIKNGLSTISKNVSPTGSSFTNIYSLDFDGVDDYAETGISDTGTNNLTISCWIKTTETFAYTLSRCAFGGRNNRAGSNYTLGRLGSKFSSPDDMKVRLFNTLGTTKLNDGNWHNIVYTYDYSTKEVKAYVDGNTTPEATATFPSFTEDYKIAIGWNGSNLPYCFQGNIDECAVWYSILGASDITAIYNSGSPTDLSLLSTLPIAWFRNGDNGAYKSPQWLIPNNENKDKLSNYSFEFDGVDDSIECGNLSSLVDNKSKLSISFWINLPVAHELNRITGKYAGLTKWIGINCTGDKVNWVVSNIGSSQAYASTGVVLSDNTWHHVVCVFDGTQPIANDRIKIYIDNVDEALTVNGSLPTSTYDFTLEGTNPTWYLGQNGYSLGADELRGKLDEYAIYSDVALTALQVNELYNGGTPTTLSSGVSLRYKMGEESNFTSNWLVDNSALSNYSKRSFEFDGIDDYVNLGNNNSDLQPTGAFSLSVWVKFDSLTGIQGVWEATSTGGGGNDGYVLWKSSSHKFQFYIRQGTSWKTASATTTVITDTWYHILCTWDGSATSKIFVNGTEEGSQSVSSINYNANTTINLGGYRAESVSKPYQMNGSIDEASLFHSEISIGDVWNGSGEPIDVSAVSGIVSNYRMGEDASFNGTNWTIPDQVGTNDGTSDGMMVDALVGEAPKYSGGGISDGMDIEDRVGNAPNSENNALSYNMEREDRVEDTP